MASGDRESDDLKIEKLKGRINYPSWKTDMRMILIRKGLWRIVQTRPLGDWDTLATAVQDQHEKAWAEIGLRVTQAQHIHIRHLRTGYDAWQKYLTLFEGTNPAMNITKKQQFLGMKMSLEESVSGFIGRVADEEGELVSLGVKVDEDDVVGIILKGVTEPFRTITDLVKYSAISAQVPIKRDILEQALIDKEIQVMSLGKT